MTRLPAEATDCHHHIYDDRFLIPVGISAQPSNATASEYCRLQRRLGLGRNVVVQPSAYCTDNRCLVDALRQFGPTARGVAVVDTAVADKELKHLDAEGVRAIRFNFASPGVTSPDMIAPLARRVADLGWHVQLNADADMILRLASILSDLPCSLVLDHLAHIPHPAGVSHPAFRLVRTLLDTGRTWIKLSAPYSDTQTGEPDYTDATAICHAYVAAAPERMLWGSDWPHPSMAPDCKPDGAELVDLLAVWVGNETDRYRILVINPAVLFGFP